MGILNNIITMNRGDTYKLAIKLDNFLVYDEPVKLGQNDTIYFGIMDAGQPFEYALIRKAYNKDNITENNELIIVLQPDNTIDLLPGKYYYSIKLRKFDADSENFIVKTLIDKSKFILCD